MVTIEINFITLIDNFTMHNTILVEILCFILTQQYKYCDISAKPRYLEE